MEWTVEFYRDIYHREPAAEFLDSLPVVARAKVVRLLNLLAEYGVLLSGTIHKTGAGQTERTADNRPAGGHPGTIFRLHGPAPNFITWIHKEDRQNTTERNRSCRKTNDRLYKTIWR